MANNGLSAAALILAAGKSGGGGGEPSQYIKNASVSENTLTLTKKDGSEVEFTPEQPDVDKTYVDEEIARVENEIPEVPTNVSAFTNDAGYLTEHQDISGLATKTELAAETTAREASETALTNAINTKQDELTAGDGIKIENNVISLDVQQASGGSY